MRLICQYIWGQWANLCGRDQDNEGPSNLVTLCPEQPYNGGTHLPDITVITPVLKMVKFCSLLPAVAITLMWAARHLGQRLQIHHIDEEGTNRFKLVDAGTIEKRK